MGRFKIKLIKDVLELSDITVVISDIDTAWVRNPIPYFKRYPGGGGGGGRCVLACVPFLMACIHLTLCGSRTHGPFTHT